MFARTARISRMVTCASSLIILIMLLATSTALGDPPERESSSPSKRTANLPEGYELQKLPLKGAIAKPVHWVSETRAKGKTYATKIWEPLPGNKYGFHASVQIDVITNVAETGKTPSEYARILLQSLEKQGKIHFRFEPTEHKGLKQFSSIVDQPLQVGDSKEAFRIRYLVIANDDLELLYLVRMGAKVTKWKDYLPTFKAMTGHLVLPQLAKDERSSDRDNTNKGRK